MVGSADLVHGARNQFGQRAAAQAHVAVDVLHHHDGIVHQDADRKDEREQRNAVDREAPGPGSEQRGCQSDGHCRADDHGFPSAHGEHHQKHDGRCGEEQFLDELLGLVVGRLAVVARHGELDAFRHVGAAQVLDSLDHLAGDADRVDARLLRNRDRDRRSMRDIRQPARSRARTRSKPGIRSGLFGLCRYVGHFFQIDRTAAIDRDDEPRDIIAVGQEFPRVHRRDAILAHQRADVLHDIGRHQCPREVSSRQAVAGELLRIQLHANDALRAADRVDVACTGHALDLSLDRVRNLPRLVRAAFRILGPERQRDDRNIVDTFWLHQRLREFPHSAAASRGSSRWRCRAARWRPCAARPP